MPTNDLTPERLAVITKWRAEDWRPVWDAWAWHPAWPNLVELTNLHGFHPSYINHVAAALDPPPRVI